jgi:hypothetical protein
MCMAVIERRNEFNQYTIRDLQSRDGTFVNSSRLKPDAEVFLQLGDQIRFGRTMVRQFACGISYSQIFTWQSFQTRVAQPQRYQDERPMSIDREYTTVVPLSRGRAYDDGGMLPSIRNREGRYRFILCCSSYFKRTRQHTRGLGQRAVPAQGGSHCSSLVLMRCRLLTQK